MTRISNVSTLQQSLGLRQIVSRQTTEADRLRQEVASGMKGDVFAQNSPAATRSMEVRVHRTTNSAFLQSNQVLQGQLAAMSESMAGIVEIGRSFLNLSLSGAIMGDNRDVYRQQARTALGQISSLLNSTYAGDYMFSGLATGTPAVRMVEAPPAPVGVEYLGSTQPVAARIDDSTVLHYGITASHQAIRTTLDAISTALNADVDSMTEEEFEALRTQVAAQLDSGLQSLAAVQSKLGSQQQMLDDRIDRQHALETLYTREVADIEGADVEETAVRLQSMETQLRATYEVTARMGRMSLLDYL